MRDKDKDDRKGERETGMPNDREKIKRGYETLEETLGDKELRRVSENM